jgi:hypothetical protein
VADQQLEGTLDSEPDDRCDRHNEQLSIFADHLTAWPGHGGVLSWFG